ncbi:MAG TPA: NYN domain-containing protein [Candidatus Paceibacterota bacterium]
MRTYAFIDASNLFYGGEKSLGWKIDYEKLLKYLKEKYEVEKAFYFGGVEIHGFGYNYLENDSVPLNPLKEYLENLLDESSESKKLVIQTHLQRVKFYIRLDKFGYKLFLKPVKLYDKEDGSAKRKANCDVDMAFRLMKEKNNFERAIILSGDGDFLPVLKYLQNNEKKEVVILARGPRAAKEIRQFAGSKFLDFTRLKHKLSFEEKK